MMRWLVPVLLGAWVGAAAAQGPPPPPRADLDPAFDAHRQITDRALLEVLNRRSERVGPPDAREVTFRRRPAAGGALATSQDRRPVYVGAVRVEGGGRWVFRRANARIGEHPPAGWFALGDVLEGPRQNVRAVPLVHAGDDPEALAPPQGWRALGRFGEGPGAIRIWEPVPPRGYRALGVVALPEGEAPETARMLPVACVKREYTEPRVRFRYGLLRAPGGEGFWLRRVGLSARAGTDRHDHVWWLKD